jgi:hypothetical protein
MTSRNYMVRWSMGAVAVVCLVLLAILVMPTVRADEIDWNQVKETWEKSLRGEQLSPEQKASLDRARSALGKQGIDVKRLDEVGKKVVGGEALSADDQA